MSTEVDKGLHPDRSYPWTRADGKSVTYSTFPDLEKAYCLAGGDANDREELCKQAVFKWVSQAQVGCVYAINLAKNSDEAKWKSFYVSKEDLSIDLINQAIEESVQSGDEALHIIVDRIDGDEGVVELINSLCTHESGLWYWDEVEWKNVKQDLLDICKKCGGNRSAHDDVINPPLLVGLRHKLSNGYVSWTLGICACSTMPVTRKFVGAEFVIIALRTGCPKEPQDPDKLRSVGDPVHLCDMDSLLSKEKDDAVWTATEHLKSLVLADEMRCCARAKVSFVIPGQLKAQICPPMT